MIEIKAHGTPNDFNDDDLVCYCFKYTKKDIVNDYLRRRHSSIYEKISLEKKLGKCNCARENPRGR